MDTQRIIDDLQNSDLYAECPCGAEFKLSDLILFDGTKPFPPEVLELQAQYDEELRKRAAKLEKNQNLMNFVSENRSTLSLILPSPFPWIFVTLNNLLLSRILSPMLYPEWSEVFDADLNFKKDCIKVLDTIKKIQGDIRKLVGYDTDIVLDTKYPLE